LKNLVRVNRDFRFLTSNWINKALTEMSGLWY
jgi:hypothetical protein